MRSIARGRAGRTLCRVATEALAATSLALFATAAARADDLTGGIGLASDKMVRGTSQSGGRPSLLLDLTYRTDTRWAISLGAASLGLGKLADNGRGTNSDSEIYLGVARTWQLDDDWTLQLGSTAYAYPGSRDPFYGEYIEFGASVNWRGALSAAFAATPSISGRDRSGRPRRGATGALELGAHAPLNGPWALDGGVGWHNVSGLGNRPYLYGSLGVSWRHGPSQLFLTWITSRSDERNGVRDRVAGDRTVLSYWWSF